MLLGLNGAGKSTLFSVITHLYASRSGVVRIFGRDVARESGAALAALGVVFQQRTLDPDLSVAQNLAYHGALHGHRPARDARRAQAIQLARVGLADRPTTRCASFPAARCAGSRSRARSCTRRACCCSTSRRRDSTSRRGPDILKLVRGLVADDGIGVLWTTHLVDEIRDEDHVIVLHKGRVLADGQSRTIVGAAGARSIGDAFTSLTGGGEGGEG